MTRILLIVAFVAALPWAVLRADQTQDDLKSLEGMWKSESIDIEGFAKDFKGEMKLTIKSNEYTLRVGKVVDKFTLKIDASKSPKSMDLTAFDGKNKGKTFLAIYELAGDSLTICQALEGDRPKAFKTANVPSFMLTFKREKP